MAQSENLNIILKAKTKDLEQKLKRSERRIQHFEKKSKKSLGNTTKAFNKLGAAAAGFAAALSARAFVSGLRNALDGAVQIQNLSRLAGIATGEFQVLTLTAKQFGIGQEKLADILKDVNDKFGDFTEANSGPLKDFFEFIAPKVGLTADAFADLSSSEKLGAYINALRKANVSQSEMTFYMEAIASDSTALVAAFDNGGAAIEAMRIKAEKLGLVLEDDFIANAAEAKLEADLLSEVIKNNLNKAFIAMAPLLVGASEKLATFMETAEDFFTSDTFKNIASFTPAGIAFKAFIGKTEQEDINNLLQKRIRLQGELSAFKTNIKDLKNPTSQQEGEINKTLDSFKEAISNIDKQLVNFQDNHLDNLDLQLDVKTNLVVNSDTLDAAAKALEDPNEAAKQKISDLKEIARQRRIGAKAVELERIELEKQNIILKGMPKDAEMAPGSDVSIMTIQNAAAAAEAQKIGDAYEKAAIAASDILNPTKDLKDDIIAAKSEMDLLIESMLKASPALISLGFDAKGLKQIMEGVQGGVEETMMAFVDGSKSGKDAFKSMALAIIQDIYRIQVAQKVAGIITGVIGGMFGGSSAPMHGGGRAAGGPVKAGQSYVTGEHGRELFVPKTDGRVLSAGQTKNSQSGEKGVTIIQNNTFSGGVQRSEINEMLPKIIKAAEAGVFNTMSRRPRG